METILAKNAGFCFGVKRATERLRETDAEKKPGERIYTLGHLIHNEAYLAKLEAHGIFSVSAEEVPDLISEATEQNPVTLLIRAHGMEKETEELLQSADNPAFRYLDCTCPFVSKIHKIVSELDRDKDLLLLMGDENHPEVKGILSRFAGEKYVFADPEELETFQREKIGQNESSKSLNIVAQTTYNIGKWNKTQKILKKLFSKVEIYDTICSVTQNRQTEAEALSDVCDGMIVIGGRESSNTNKLYDICRNRCPLTVRLYNAGELDKRAFQNAHKVGIVAGASTPDDEITEVCKTMSEMNENFEALLETQCKTLNTGDVVTGIVTHVDDNEIQLDLGAAVTGYIKAEQFSDNGAKLTDVVKVGDKVDAFVIRVSDIDGMAELSKKRVDADRNWFEIVKAEEEKTVLEGTVIEAVKGGVVILCNSNRVFVPASQTNVPKDGDLFALVNKTVKFKVIEVKNGKKAVGSIRVVEREERKAKEAAFWSTVEEGKVYHGTVRSMTTYGAFVDLGGVDGMVHVTELSWKHIKNPAEVVKVGDQIDVFVKSFDAEKKRISLGYKTEATNPWLLFKNQYIVGDVVSVKIVSMMPFGAFAEIIDGVDGLIHISQISTERIAKPSDLLSIGQVVDARIIEIDDEKQKVGLSIRVLIEEAQAAEEAMPEEPVAEATEANEEQ